MARPFELLKGLAESAILKQRRAAPLERPAHDRALPVKELPMQFARLEPHGRSGQRLFGDECRIAHGSSPPAGDPLTPVTVHPTRGECQSTRKSPTREVRTRQPPQRRELCDRPSLWLLGRWDRDICFRRAMASFALLPGLVWILDSTQ